MTRDMVCTFRCDGWVGGCEGGGREGGWVEWRVKGQLSCGEFHRQFMAK